MAGQVGRSRAVLTRPLLDVRGVSKAYPGVQALNSVSFSVGPGEVHALLGANGAGKSTLIKILAGAVARDAGDILLDGQAISLADPHEAVKRGVASLFQDPALVPFLSVEQNIFLGQEDTSSLGFIRTGPQRSAVRALLAHIAPQLNPATPVHRLRTSERQLVALAKALLRHPKLVIMDEPSASMTDPEIEALFATVRHLKASGTSVLYITHRLEEVYQIAETITVIRDGRHILTRPIREIARAELIDTIAGHEVRAETRRGPILSGKPLLEIEDLQRPGAFGGISFAVRAGEVVALTGLVGSGRTEIARAIFQADQQHKGVIRYPNPQIRVRTPSDAVAAGLAMIPEDRKVHGIVPKMSVGDNLMMSSIRRHLRGWTGLVRRDHVRQTVERNIQQLRIRPLTAARRPIETLSGGNQQKVLLARAMESEASVLILDEPTAGVDIGSKTEIHRLILQLAERGKGILLISSEMEEVLALADRILVIREGRLVREFEGPAASSLEVSRSALGSNEGPHPDGG